MPRDKEEFFGKKMHPIHLDLRAELEQSIELKKRGLAFYGKLAARTEGNLLYRKQN
jgi:hypothetical protein